ARRAPGSALVPYPTLFRSLSVSAQESAAVLRVHDDGPGIDPEVRDELFARFARGDAPRARQTGGTGLGLAIAKAIVEGHGGSIEVTSDPGDTTFTVRLPVTAPAAAPQTPQRPHAPEPPQAPAQAPVSASEQRPPQ